MVTAAMLAANLAFIVLLLMLSRLLEDESDYLAFALGDGADAVVIGREVLWKIALPFVAFSSLLFTVWIFAALIRPLRKIAQSLRTGSPACLEGLLNQPSELGEVARSLNEAFRQREALQDEIALRRRLEARLRESELRLQSAGHDRERFIHDLHDGLIQSLFATGLMLEQKKVELERHDEVTAGFLGKVTAEINGLLSRLRISLQKAAPFLREVYSLAAEVEALVERFDKASPLRCELDLADWSDDQIDPRQAMELHAICAESLVNVVRHARARRVRITLSSGERDVELKVADDGVGLAAAARPGMGLESMRLRAQRLGGKFDLDSSPGKGTTIRVSVPRPFRHGGRA